MKVFHMRTLSLAIFVWKRPLLFFCSSERYLEIGNSILYSVLGVGKYREDQGIWMENKASYEFHEGVTFS